MMLLELILPTTCSTPFPLEQPDTTRMATIAAAKTPRIDIVFSINPTINSFSKKKTPHPKGAESELT
jgi:hypothetical protein